MSHSHMSGMSDMPMAMSMTFFTSTATPLYSASWTPSGAGSYAGTCIFLILLAVLFRSFFALRVILEARWLDQALQRRYVVVRRRTPEAESVEADPDAKEASLVSARGVEEKVKVVKREKRGAMPWRFSVDLPRAALVGLTAGVGYLL